MKCLHFKHGYNKIVFQQVMLFSVMLVVIIGVFSKVLPNCCVQKLDFQTLPIITLGAISKTIPNLLR